MPRACGVRRTTPSSRCSGSSSTRDRSSRRGRSSRHPDPSLDLSSDRSYDAGHSNAGADHSKAASPGRAERRRSHEPPVTRARCRPALRAAGSGAAQLRDRDAARRAGFHRRADLPSRPARARAGVAHRRRHAGGIACEPQRRDRRAGPEAGGDPRRARACRRSAGTADRGAAAGVPAAAGVVRRRGRGRRRRPPAPRRVPEPRSLSLGARAGGGRHQRPAAACRRAAWWPTCSCASSRVHAA